MLEFTSVELVRAIIDRIENPDRPGLEMTPVRVVESWKELYAGYDVDISKLFTIFEEPSNQMVVLRDIEFYSMCEHHMLPFFGKASVGYLPKGNRVIGVSKLARLVDAFSRRLQIQERIGQQVTEAIEQHLKPLGAACLIEAQHMCMTCRGVSKQNSVMVTSSITGEFQKPEVRAEFFTLCGK